MEAGFWLLELLFEPLLKLLIWLVLLPIMLVAATPLILLTSFWGVQSYWLNVCARYAVVTQWWGGLLRYA